MFHQSLDTVPIVLPTDTANVVYFNWPACQYSNLIENLINTPNIKNVLAEVQVIEAMLTDQLEGFDHLISLQGEEIIAIDGRSQENANVIRAILRRFEKQFRDQETRICDLEKKTRRDR